MGEYIKLGWNSRSMKKKIFCLNFIIFFTLTSKDTFCVHHTVIFETRYPYKKSLRVSWSGYEEMSTPSQLSNRLWNNFVCD